MFTGARQANGLAMVWKEIGFDLGIWTIPKTKNVAPQTIPLTRYAMEVLEVGKENEKEKSSWVFPGSRQSGHLVEPKTVWRRQVYARLANDPVRQGMEKAQLLI